MTSTCPPEILHDHADETKVLIGRLREWCTSHGSAINILEAGCGRQWSLTDLPCPYRLTGLDLDQEALRIRQQEVCDLDEAIHGDLRDALLPSQHFDLIYCAYVLEHIRGTDTVLQNFIRWLKPGGAIVIKIPDGLSAYGAITRFTPHWFHILYYRWIRGNLNAGKPGFPPYPTVFESTISYPGLLHFAEMNGLNVAGAWATRVDAGTGIRGWLIRTALRFVELVTFGHYPSTHNTLTILLVVPIQAASK